MFRRRAAYGGGGGLGLGLLALHVARTGMQHIPPVTLATLALCTALHYAPQFGYYFDRESEYLVPARVVRGDAMTSLLAAALLHVDDMHLYYNMASLIAKGRALERVAFSSELFAIMLLGFAIASNALYTAVCLAGAHLAPGLLASPHTPVVGFSAVLFGLKVVVTEREGHGLALGAAYWSELVLASLLSPRASFVGHLCGILVGIAFVLAARANALRTWLAPRVDGAAWQPPRVDDTAWQPPPVNGASWQPPQPPAQASRDAMRAAAEARAHQAARRGLR